MVCFCIMDMTRMRNSIKILLIMLMGMAFNAVLLSLNVCLA